MKTKKLVLSIEQYIFLCDKLREMRNFFESEKPTLRQAAGILSKHVGFPVHEKHVERARKATGITWGTDRPKHIQNGLWPAIKEAISFLYESLGIPIPDHLTRFLTHATTENHHAADNPGNGHTGNGQAPGGPAPHSTVQGPR